MDDQKMRAAFDDYHTAGGRLKAIGSPDARRRVHEHNAWNCWQFAASWTARQILEILADEASGADQGGGQAAYRAMAVIRERFGVDE